MDFDFEGWVGLARVCLLERGIIMVPVNFLFVCGGFRGGGDVLKMCGVRMEKKKKKNWAGEGGR